MDDKRQGKRPSASQDDDASQAMGAAPGIAQREKIRAGARAALFGEPGPATDSDAPTEMGIGTGTGTGPRRKADLEDPRTIGRFQVLERLGAGGMGVVFAAYDAKLDRRIAIKLLRPDLANDPEDTTGTSRLEREAQAMARLSHPNVVAVHEVGEYDDQVFVAMEFVAGTTLTQWVERGQPWRAVVAAFCDAAAGLAAAHAAGIVHRDFKPDNVMVGDDGRVRVMDFGLSVATGAAEPQGDAADPDAGVLSSRLTQTGAVMGTPAYMAPEQHNAKEVTAASDQFAFCVALWEALTKERPYAGETYGELAGNVVTGRIRPVPPDAAAPRRVFELLRTGLATKQADRHPSMEALATALAHDPARLRKWVLGGAAVVLATAGVTWSLTPTGTPPHEACSNLADALDDAWGADARKQMQVALTASEAPYADDTWATTQDLLQSYATSWTDAATQLCAAKLVDEDADGTLARREACLEARRSDFTEMSAVLRSQDKGVAMQAVQAAASLSSVEGCSDPRRLDAYRVTRDPETTTELSKARAGLARAKARGMMGNSVEAIADADAVVTRARQLDDPATEAAGLLVRGQYEERGGDRRLAESTLREAIKKAEIAHDHATRVLALIRLIYVVGSDPTRHAEAQALGADAGAVLRTLGSDPLLQAKLDMNLGGADRAARQHDAALAHYQAALTSYTEIYGDAHPETARALTSLGSVYISLARSEEAIEVLERARLSFESTLGAQHPFVAVVMGNLGTAQGKQKDYDAAIGTLSAALKLRRAADGPTHPGVARTLFNLGNIQYQAGRYAAAIESLQAGEDILAPTDPPPRQLGRFQLLRGASELMLGHRAVAQGILDPLLDVFEVGRGQAGDYGRRLRYLTAISHLEDDLPRARMWVQVSLEGLDEDDPYEPRFQALLWLFDTVEYGPQPKR